ncbi:MAG: hypothetical protein II794_00470 [Oscillospiraceae bacterium]|nr:hypothetical protein [Oscillospiraceae bacterium]
MKKTIALVLAALMLCAALASCGGPKVDGTYTVSMDSVSYFSTQAVKNDREGTDMRPDGSEARVPFSTLFGMLDTRVGKNEKVDNYYTVSLELKDGSYKLVKKFAVNLDYVADAVKGMMSSEIPTLELTFTGKYTADGTKVTLAVPTKVEANVSPVAGMADAYTRFGGTYMGESASAADPDVFPGKFFYYFNTLYFIENSAVSEMTVTVDAANGTFTA